METDNIISLEERVEAIEQWIADRGYISEAFLLGKKISGTTSGTAGTQTTHKHYLPREPKVVFITSKSNGVVYLTDKDDTNIYVKGSASSLDFDAYCLL